MWKIPRYWDKPLLKQKKFQIFITIILLTSVNSYKISVSFGNFYLIYYIRIDNKIQLAKLNLHRCMCITKPLYQNWPWDNMKIATVNYLRTWEIGWFMRIFVSSAYLVNGISLNHINLRGFFYQRHILKLLHSTEGILLSVVTWMDDGTTISLLYFVFWFLSVVYVEG